MLAIATALLATIALTLLGWPASDYRHSDFFQFWAGSRLLFEGSDPYDRVQWARIYAREASGPLAMLALTGRSAYPPWSMIVLLPLGALPFAAAAATWLIAQVTLVLWALLALARSAGCARRELVLLLGIAAAFQPLWLIVGGGNITGFMFAAFVVALLATLRGRPIVAGVALALLAVKPHLFLLAVPALFAVAPPPARPRIAIAGSIALALLVAVTLPFGSSLFGEWLASAADLQRTTGSNATVWTIGRVLPGGAVVGAALATYAVAVLILWWRAARRGPLELVAGAVPISLFVAPHGWSYDQVLLLVPLVVILRDIGTMTDRRRIAALLAVAAIAVVLPWALYAIAVQRGGEEWSAMTPLAVFGMLVWAGGSRPADRERGQVGEQTPHSRRQEP